MPDILRRSTYIVAAALALTLTLFTPYLVVLAAIGNTIISDKGIPPEIFDAKSLALLWSSVKLSILVAFGSLLAASLLIGSLWAIKSASSRMAILISTGLLFCLSPVIHLIGWRTIPGFALLPTLLSTSGVLIWRSFPVMVFMLLLGVVALDRPGLEMAMIHSGWREVMRRIVLPRLLPMAFMGGMTIFVFTFMEGEVPPLLGMRVYPEEFMSRICLESTLGGAAVGALPFFLVAIVSLAVVLRFWPRGVQQTWQQNGIAVLDSYVRGFHSTWAVTAFIIAGMMIPVALLLKAADNKGFIGLLAKNGEAFFTSFKLGILSALLTLVTAYILTDLLLASAKLIQEIILGSLVVQLFLPGSLLGLGMIEVSHLPGLDWLNNDNILLVITHCLRQIPYAVLLLVWLRWLDINQSRDELRLVGASWLNTIRHIRLPKEWPRLVVIMGIVLVLALSELTSTILVVAPGTETIILRIYNLMHYGDREAVAALAFVQALVTILLLLLPITLVRKMRSDTN
ncbi:MAG: hypothetical protein WC156_09795 [Pedobacter sp.]